MRRRTIVSPPIGMFAGQEPLPQGLSESVHRDLLAGMVSDPGLRTASMGRRRHRSGAVEAQAFLASNGGPNSREALAAVPVTVNRKRSAIGRGTPTTPAV